MRYNFFTLISYISILMTSLITQPSDKCRLPISVDLEYSSLAVSPMKITKKTIFFFLLLLLLILGKFFYQEKNSYLPDFPSQQIIQAYADRKSNVQVESSGIVVKLLPDDLKGAKHQKFLVKITTDLTILIAHNIDLAPRINSLKEGERISFFGEYEWTSKGGTVHWTHHDPGKRHPDGWIKYRNRVYQ